MVENKLEELLITPYRLGAEFDPDKLPRRSSDLYELSEQTKTYFTENTVYGLVNFICQLDDIWDSIMPLAFAYVYYFVSDYLFRKSQTPSTFNYAFIKKGLSEENANYEAKLIYDSSRKNLKPFFDMINTQTDPMHFNPLYFTKDLEKDKYKRAHFSGQIIKYFQKCFTICQNDAKDSAETVDYEILDFLPSLSLIALHASTLLPMGKYMKKGSYSIKKIKNLNYRVENTLKNSPYCKYPELLYNLAIEDLFHINRINISIRHYLDLVNSIDSTSIEQQETILSTFYSLLYNMPSTLFQNLYKNNVEKAVMEYLNENPRAICKFDYPIINIGNILFPQVILVLIFSLFTDHKGQIYSDEIVENILIDIEKYIDENLENINKHFTNEVNPYIWDDEALVFSIRQNKGLKQKKRNGNIIKTDESRISTEYELFASNNKLSFERITELLLSSEPRWRYSTLIEENLTYYIAGFYNTNCRKIYIQSENGKELIIRYTSDEYITILQERLLNSLNLSFEEIIKQIHKIETYPNPFRLV